MLKRSSEIITVIQHGEKVIEAINRWSMVFRFVNPGMERINTIISPDISIVGLSQKRWVLFIIFIVVIKTAVSLIVETDPYRTGKVKEGKYQLRNTTGKGPVKASTTWLGKFVEVIIKIT